MWLRSRTFNNRAKPKITWSSVHGKLFVVYQRSSEWRQRRNFHSVSIKQLRVTTIHKLMISSQFVHLLEREKQSNNIYQSFIKQQLFAWKKKHNYLLWFTWETNNNVLSIHKWLYINQKTSITNMILIGIIIIFGMTLNLHFIYNILHDSLIAMNFRTGFQMENHDFKLIFSFVVCLICRFVWDSLEIRWSSIQQRHFFFDMWDVNHDNSCKSNY